MSHHHRPAQPSQAQDAKSPLLPLGMLFMVFGLLIAGCGGGDSAATDNASDGGVATEDAPVDNAGSDVDDADATSDADASSDGDSLWQGELQTISGEAIDMSAFADTDVVMWFWAPW